ncbi:MAG: DUF7689 domain-containing protein, partial [Geminicoccaceae bacterium]
MRQWQMPGSHGLKEMDEQYYRQYFPLLSDIEKKKTSDPDVRYNCIAWVFGDTRRVWWPNKKRCYWPLATSGKSRLEAFKQLFARAGWTETANSAVEPKLQKIALYVLLGEPTHAAKLLPSGWWSSKLGPDIDLAHKLDELKGPVYG